MEFISLDKEFNYQGYHFNQEYRDTENYCIYSASKNNRIKYYEVFQTYIQKPYELHGNKIPSKEFYPGNSSFGRTAWAPVTYERCLEKIKELKLKKSCIQIGQSIKISDGTPKKRGRKIVPKLCQQCSILIPTGLFQQNSGKCLTCKPNPKIKIS